MNTARNRAAVKARLRDLAAGMGSVDLGDGRTAEVVSVSYDHPGADGRNSILYLTDVSGRTDPVTIGRACLSDDTFSVGGRIETYGYASVELADRGAEAILNAYDAVLRRCQRLVDTTHAIADGADPNAYAVAWAYIGDVTGPLHGYPQQDGDTAAGFVDFAVECRTELQ